jgi:hypothetical protein
VRAAGRRLAGGARRRVLDDDGRVVVVVFVDRDRLVFRAVGANGLPPPPGDTASARAGRKGRAPASLAGSESGSRHEWRTSCAVGCRRTRRRTKHSRTFSCASRPARSRSSESAVVLTPKEKYRGRQGPGRTTGTPFRYRRKRVHVRRARRTLADTQHAAPNGAAIRTRRIRELLGDRFSIIAASPSPSRWETEPCLSTSPRAPPATVRVLCVASRGVDLSKCGRLLTTRGLGVHESSLRYCASDDLSAPCSGRDGTCPLCVLCGTLPARCPRGASFFPNVVVCSRLGAY